MTTELSEINEKLKGMIVNQEARIRVTVQTGYNECGMVATADGYLRLAQSLVEFILKAQAKETETWITHGCDKALPGSAEIGRLFHGADEVQLDTVELAETEEQANQVAEAVWLGSPPSWYKPAPHDRSVE